MNFHIRLIGALDAVMLGLAAAVTFALLLALINPTYDAGGSGIRAVNAAPATRYADSAA